MALMDGDTTPGVDADDAGGLAATPATAGSGRLAATASAGLIAAAAQFVVLTVLAMFVYAGGSAFDAAAPSYSFTQNFFSDLGRTVAFDGAANTLASVLFTYALICVGVALAAFGVAVRRLGVGARGARLTAAAATITAIVSGLAYIGIACTPYDMTPNAHTRFVDCAFGFLLIFVVCLVGLEIRAGWPRRFVVANLAYAALLTVYVYLLFWGPSTDTTDGLFIMVVAQKIIVYSSIVNLGWQAYGFRRRS